MRFNARPYQHLIIDHIIKHPRCNVWAGMGLGKTSSTLAALDALLLVEDGPALVIAPLRVALSTWPQEARKWDDFHHLRVVPIVGSVKDRRHALQQAGDIFTVNYENLPWLVSELGDRWPFRIVVADESTKLKGFRVRQGAQRAQALASVAHSKVSRFVNLTGTPAPNGLVDLWGQCWFLDRGERLGRSFSAFEQRWFRSERVGSDAFAVRLVPFPHAQNEIEQRLRDITISLDAKDWFDLSDPIVNVIRLDLPPAAREIYLTMESDFFAQIDGADIEAHSAASKSTKCLQIASGAMYTDSEGKAWATVHDGKIDALRDVIEEAAGMPVMVVYHWRHDVERLKAAFPQGRVLDKSPSTEQRWNEGKIPVLFVHPQSAGHGLSLQHGGNILVFFSHWWNLEEYQQVIERIGPVRQAQSGYDRPVYIHHLIAADTLDEVVMSRRESKKEVQELLLDAMRKRKDAKVLC